MALFSSIEEVVGYQNRLVSPWKDWESVVRSKSNTHLIKDFTQVIPSPNSNYHGSRSVYAWELALQYQISKDTRYSDKAKEALLYYSVGVYQAGASGRLERSGALEKYALTYDWIYPILTPTENITIRDTLATLANTCYNEVNKTDTGSTETIAVTIINTVAMYAALGVASVLLWDYTNPNGLPITSTPQMWYDVGRYYLFENDILHSGR